MSSQLPPIYKAYDSISLDREYNARESVPSFQEEYDRYIEASLRAKQTLKAQSDIVYDLKSGEKLDIYRASADNAPLFLWIHGGYWRSSSKEDNAFVALGLVPHGVSVAVMNYTLAPIASLDEIVRQVRAAAEFLHNGSGSQNIAATPIAVGGSSAGGHLVGMLIAEGWGGSSVAAQGIGTALTLSGLFDLQPLRYTSVNSWLSLNEEDAIRNSPIRNIPSNSDTHLIASVGGRETSEFRRQTADYAAAWRTGGKACDIVAMPNYNHFDIALSLSDPDSPLVLELVRSIRRWPTSSSPG
ncbi:MAG: alpha/beta hydrolase [Bradyrhizobium sp.]